MIRYFCLVARGAAGDAAHAYLVALAQTGRPLRAQPIGLAQFDCEPRWWQVTRLFTRPMGTRFVNVVCARPGLALGVRLPARALRPQGADDPLRELERAIGPLPDAPDDVYQPELALAGLYTVGCRNVAITSATPPPSDVELAALHRYDLVIATSPDDRDRLRDLLGHRHPRVVHVPPDASLLGAFLDELCGSSTSATTPPSPATGAPAATTAPPSTAPATISGSSTGSRSPATRSAPSALRSRGSGRWMISWCRGLWRWATTTWRSFTARRSSSRR
ncbi:MAG: hypothetical protein IT338_17545 [Thermomicrobiales bacterium]|nr:hypothetical protein [Thermomicrobiales bacterium]